MTVTALRAHHAYVRTHTRDHVMHENILTNSLARLASVPFRLFGRRPFQPPRKALILKPCCLSQVLLATPLLAALSAAYPDTQFDWAVHDHARPAVATNARLSELIDSGRVGLPDVTWKEMRAVAERIRRQGYDTCFIPSRSSMLSLVAWMAGIPQRVGLAAGGRGFAHTVAVGVPDGERHTAAIYLSLARALGIEAEAHMEFFPRDSDRTAMTELLVDVVDWLGDVPLVIMHPGGGLNPVRPDERTRWPAERFTLLGNHLVRHYKARIILVGSAADRETARSIAGMMSAETVNLAGNINLGQLGALSEMADLYVGNDTGPTHVAAAVGCPTLAIFGPTDPLRSAPYATKGPVIALGPQDASEPFSWETNVLPDEAFVAAETLLQRRPEASAAPVEEAPAADA